MRLIVDLQGAQTGSRLRGIGRYSLSLVKAMAQSKGSHEIVVALSGLLSESIDDIRKEFEDFLPPNGVRIWHAVGPTQDRDPANQFRRRTSELIREAFLASLQPDVVLVTSLFEGLTDDAVTSIGLLGGAVPCATVLYDLVPLINPDEHFKKSEMHRAWYARKFDYLRRSERLLAISESSRQEALMTGHFSANSVVNISGACDSSFRKMALSESEVTELWGRFGITRPFIFYSGGADERKNLPRLIEAYATMPARVRDVTPLVLSGDMHAGSVNQLLTVSKKFGLARDHIIFTGYISDLDLVKLYNTCRLFVFPSLHEGFGLPPLEAMACGAPVIAGNTTSLPEVIGLPEAMFDPRSTREICETMERGLTEQEFRIRLHAHGKQQIAKFSWANSAAAAWRALEGLGVAGKAAVSSMLNVERTSIFKKRTISILIIKLDHLGDFLLAMPAISKLRARYPHALIDIIVGSWNVDIAKQLNLFNAIYTYDFFKQQSSQPPNKNEPALASLLAEIGSYDIALDLRRQPETRFVLSNVRARTKVAYATFDDELNRKLDIALPVFTESAFNATPLNKTSISLQLIRLVDAIPGDPNDFVTFPAIGERLKRMEGTVAIFPKAGSAVREWNQANFRRLIDLLASNSSVVEIEVYFANEREASGFSLDQHKVDVKIGLPLPALAKSLSRNSVCVTNNSGGVHLASYLGVSVIGIYSGHELTTEWGPQFFDGIVMHRAAQCAPCHGGLPRDCPNGLFCLAEISVADVYSKTLELLTVNRLRSETSIETNSGAFSLQQNTDRIVRGLLDSIADLGAFSQQEALEISEVIASNHPEFSKFPDLTTFPVNRRLDHRSSRIEWRGFSTIERQFRWTDGKSASMLFECPDGVPTSGVIELHIATLGRQRIELTLNRLKIDERSASGRHIRIKIPVHNLESGLNSLEFYIPDAKSPNNGDTRKLGIAVRHFEVLVDHS